MMWLHSLCQLGPFCWPIMFSYVCAEIINQTCLVNDLWYVCNLEDIVYVLQVSCYRTCAVYIKCPKCSCYVKGSIATPTSKIKEKCIACIHALQPLQNVHVLQVSYCRICAVYIICPSYKCSGYVKGTPTTEQLTACNYIIPTTIASYKERTYSYLLQVSFAIKSSVKGCTQVTQSSTQSTLSLGVDLTVLID